MGRRVDARGAVGRSHTPVAATGEEQSGRAEELSAERLQALGRFAGAMAHEVNNMMTAIMGFGALATAALSEQHPAHLDVVEMMKAAERAANVSRQMLVFSRHEALETTVVDACAVIADCASMLARAVGPDRTLSIDAPVPGPPIKLHRNQLEQVLLNLVANASDATPNGGRIQIAVGLVPDGEGGTPADTHGSAPTRQLVRITVRDSGPGISAEVLARVFEPFFTTKEAGKGTGLGMAIVKEIIQQHGGTVSIASEQGSGTVVIIHLPLANTSPATLEAAPPRSMRGRGERILVVEDEGLVGTVVRRLLAVNGYSVVVVSNGEAALDYMRMHAGVVDLVITDVIMYGLNGIQLARKIEAEFPGVAVVLMSAYTGDEIARRGGAMSIDSFFIQKPFAPDALIGVVQEALRARGGDPSLAVAG